MKIIWVALLVVIMPLAQTVAAEKSGGEESGVVIQKVKSTGSFEDVLREMWGRLRSMVPKMASDSHVRRTQIAGVRGAESTGTLLKPYWKGDRTQDLDYLKELAVYHEVQQQADSGDFSAAVNGFNRFIKVYPQSRLRANAQFGLGLAYVGVGARQKSIIALNQFIKAYPKHPLSADALEMLLVLDKS
ncbi:MAG: outer membrane protein assembly factor BamD [Acidiferrobacterales bacterium]